MSSSIASSIETSAQHDFVLDSFAVIAYFEDEPGAEIVDNLIRRVPQSASLFLSVINFGEIAYEAERERGDAELHKRLAQVRALPIALVGVDEKTVLAAAHIKANYVVSYADAFAIALAQGLNATIVTGDSEFQSVEKIIPILWLKEPIRKQATDQEKKVREPHTAYRTKRKSKRSPLPRKTKRPSHS